MKIDFSFDKTIDTEYNSDDLSFFIDQVCEPVGLPTLADVIVSGGYDHYTVRDYIYKVANQKPYKTVRIPRIVRRLGMEDEFIKAVVGDCKSISEEEWESQPRYSTAVINYHKKLFMFMYVKKLEELNTIKVTKPVQYIINWRKFLKK